MSEYLNVGLFPIIEGVPFYDRLLDAFVCVGKPPEGFTGFVYSKERVEALRNIAKVSSVFEVSGKAIVEGFGDNSPTVNVDSWATYISDIVMRSESLKRIFRLIGARGPVFIDTLIVYKEEPNPDEVEALALRMKDRLEYYPYITHLEKRGNIKENVNLFEYELAVFNPTTLFFFFPEAELNEEYKVLTEHFKCVFKENK